MAIRSKTCYRHKYINLEPIRDWKTKRVTGDVFAEREDLFGRMHLNVSSLKGDTEEEQALLDSLHPKGGMK